MTDRRRRVFLLGLDGATFTLLRPWAEEGRLPTIARLMAEGAHGPLISTVPPVTPVAWTSMVTGVYPGKHGIFGFVKSRPGSYECDVVTSRDRRRPAIWNLLDRAGLRSIVVDVPFTYPPEPINGVMVAGMGTPDVASEFVHPRLLRDTILKEFGPYPLDISYRGDIPALLDDAHRLTEHRLALIRFLMREFDWHFSMLALTATDRLQHVLWACVDPRHSRYTAEESRRHRPAILGYYKKLDEMIAELLNTGLSRDAVFLIASDHGFGPMERRQKLSLHRWLQQEGLLVLGGPCWAYAPPDQSPAFIVRGSGRVTEDAEGGGGRAGGLTFAVDRPDSFAGVVFQVPHLDPRRRYELRATAASATPGALLEFDDLTRDGHPIVGGGPLYEHMREVLAVFQPAASEIALFVGMTTYGGNPTGHIALRALVLSEREDWSRTKAYVMDTGDMTEGRRIRFNLRGREPNGIVSPGEEYEHLRDRVVSGLLALRDAHGEPLVSRVYRREELYAGPFADEGFDLMVMATRAARRVDPAGGGPGPPLGGLVAARPERGYTGNHDPEGIVIAYGDGILPGEVLAARIVDICPTVLHLLGVPVPDDADGRVLSEVLAASHRAAAPAPHVGLQNADSGSQAEGEPYTEPDRRAVEERLRKLGYLE